MCAQHVLYYICIYDTCKGSGYIIYIYNIYKYIIQMQICVRSTFKGSGTLQDLQRTYETLVSPLYRMCSL